METTHSRGLALSTLDSFVLIAGIAILLAFALRGGLLLWLFGIAVQKSDGGQASRLRCLARSLLAWSPGLLFLLLLRAGLLPGAVGGFLGISMILLLIGAGPAVYAVLRPTRGIPGRFVGTALVPR